MIILEITYISNILCQLKLSFVVLDFAKYNKGMYLNTWYITNVLPFKNRLEKGIAAFPDEIARRLIILYSYHSEPILDPFLGSDTTMKVAMELARNTIGYELGLDLKI